MPDARACRHAVSTASVRYTSSSLVTALLVSTSSSSPRRTRCQSPSPATCQMVRPDLPSPSPTCHRLPQPAIAFDRPHTGDLPPLYRAADLFVTCSTSETFGLTVLESLACGTPAVLPHWCAPRRAAAPSGMWSGDGAEIDSALSRACAACAAESSTSFGLLAYRTSGSTTRAPRDPSSPLCATPARERARRTWSSTR